MSDLGVVSRKPVQENAQLKEENAKLKKDNTELTIDKKVLAADIRRLTDANTQLSDVRDILLKDKARLREQRMRAEGELRRKDFLFSWLFGNSQSGALWCCFPLHFHTLRVALIKFNPFTSSACSQDLWSENQNWFGGHPFGFLWTEIDWQGNICISSPNESCF